MTSAPYYVYLPRSLVDVLEDGARRGLEDIEHYLDGGYARLDRLRVEVREKPGKPGSYYCVMHLRPHFQLDQVVTAVKLVTELVPGAN